MSEGDPTGTLRPEVTQTWALRKGLGRKRKVSLPQGRDPQIPGRGLGAQAGTRAVTTFPGRPTCEAHVPPGLPASKVAATWIHTQRPVSQLCLSGFESGGKPRPLRASLAKCSTTFGYHWAPWKTYRPPTEGLCFYWLVPGTR